MISEFTVGRVASAYREGAGRYMPADARATRGARAGRRHTQGTHAPPHWHACAAVGGKAGGGLTAERRIYLPSGLIALARTEPPGRCAGSRGEVGGRSASYTRAADALETSVILPLAFPVHTNSQAIQAGVQLSRPPRRQRILESEPHHPPQGYLGLALAGAQLGLGWLIGGGAKGV